MENNFKKPKYIIVLGTTFSGSRAVFDYLNGRGDLYDPLAGEEYLLPILPNGIMALEAVSDKAFDPASAEYYLTQFKLISHELMNYWRATSKDERFIKRIPIYTNIIKKFINDITSADYPMRLLWRDQLAPSAIEHILEKIKNRIGYKKRISQTRLIVSSDKFIIAAKKMHDSMFENFSESRPTLLDQGGSGWNPIESTKYFSNSKIILVTRDPRDQFAEIKHYKKGESVEGFIDWYLEMQRRLKSIEDKNVLFVRFEDFVQKNLHQLELLCNFLSLPSDISSNYQPDLSRKNIGKHKEIISHKENQIIKNKLGEYFSE